MTITKLSSDFSVSDQITPHDLAQIAASGFRAVICNRPDAEGPDQPTFAEVAAAARAAGLEAAYLPVQPGKFGAPEARAFAEALAKLPGPVLGYCRSGARAQNLWTMSQTVQTR